LRPNAPQLYSSESGVEIYWLNQRDSVEAGQLLLNCKAQNWQAEITFNNKPNYVGIWASSASVESWQIKRSPNWKLEGQLDSQL